MAHLQMQLKVKIIGPHQNDDFWLKGIAQQANSYGLSGLKNCTPDKWLNDGDIISVGKQQLQVLHCPGHTPGHVIFYNKS